MSDQEKMECEQDINSLRIISSYEDAAAQMVKEHAAARNAYDEGIAAKERGEEFWQNPHSGPTGKKKCFDAWFAGWRHKKLTSQGEQNG